MSFSGRLADRDQLVNVFLSLGLMTASLLLLLLAASSPWGAPVAVFLFGAMSFSIAAALNGRVLSFAGAAPTLAASVNVSAFNVGNAIGPWIGGTLIGAGLGLRAPVWASVALGLLAVGVATLSWHVGRGHPRRRTATGPSTGAACARSRGDRVATGCTSRNSRSLKKEGCMR